MGWDCRAKQAGEDWQALTGQAQGRLMQRHCAALCVLALALSRTASPPLPVLLVGENALYSFRSAGWSHREACTGEREKRGITLDSAKSEVAVRKTTPVCSQQAARAGENHEYKDELCALDRGKRKAAVQNSSSASLACFVHHAARAGEIHEYKEELRALDRGKRKDAVKKVIAAMTVGKDVSMLFPDVVNCMQTDDLELKKLVYLYLINYAKTQPDLAIMGVNTFVKARCRLPVACVHRGLHAQLKLGGSLHRLQYPGN